ncbi:MAG: hypothetical protein ACYC8W_01495 [Candidatus Tyrphobacter sp.]
MTQLRAGSRGPPGRRKVPEQPLVVARGMDDTLRVLRSRIAALPGYASSDDRRLTDELVRAYAGEALTAMQQRIALSEAARSQLDALILRTQFANQAAFHDFEGEPKDDAAVARVARADAALVELADRMASIEPAEAAALLNQVQSALEERDRAMLEGARAPAP